MKCISLLDDDYSEQDQVKVFSHEGDGENTEHLNSMDLHDIKTELERDAEAEKAEVFNIAFDDMNNPPTEVVEVCRATTERASKQQQIIVVNRTSKLLSIILDHKPSTSPRDCFICN